MSKLTQDEQIQFLDWLKDVLMKKLKAIPEMQQEVEELMSNLYKGGDVNMEYGVGRYFDSIVERVHASKEGRGKLFPRPSLA